MYKLPTKAFNQKVKPTKSEQNENKNDSLQSRIYRTLSNGDKVEPGKEKHYYNRRARF